MSDPTPSPAGPPPGDKPAQAITGTPGTPAPAPAPAAVTPAAPKPAAAAKPAAKKTEERRGVVGLLAGGAFAFAWATMAGTLGLWTLGTLRFLFPNVLAEPPSKVKVGFPESFEEGKVTDKF